MYEVVIYVVALWLLYFVLFQVLQSVAVPSYVVKKSFILSIVASRVVVQAATSSPSIQVLFRRYLEQASCGLKFGDNIAQCQWNNMVATYSSDIQNMG